MPGFRARRISTGWPNLSFPRRPARRRAPRCPFPILTAVGEKIPQVKAVVHMVAEEMTVIVGDRQRHQTVTFVDPNFFQVLILPLPARRSGTRCPEAAGIDSDLREHGAQIFRARRSVGQDIAK